MLCAHVVDSKMLAFTLKARSVFVAAATESSCADMSRMESLSEKGIGIGTLAQVNGEGARTPHSPLSARDRPSPSTRE